MSTKDILDKVLDPKTEYCHLKLEEVIHLIDHANQIAIKRKANRAGMKMCEFPSYIMIICVDSYSNPVTDIPIKFFCLIGVNSSNLYYPLHYPIYVEDRNLLLDDLKSAKEWPTIQKIASENKLKANPNESPEEVIDKSVVKVLQQAARILGDKDSYTKLKAIEFMCEKLNIKK